MKNISLYMLSFPVSALDVGYSVMNDDNLSAFVLLL